jgi:HAD superfamily hydrolase (TIGR01493 family)
MSIKCLAFDCFGTVFDMANVPKEQIAAYVEHVRRNDFSPYLFPHSWEKLKAHSDAADGIRMLREAGYKCVTLSNGGKDLLTFISEKNGIQWDHIIDLAAHKAYKPNNLDAYRAVEKDLGFKPEETMMVTANPTFGDVEGAAAVGMHSIVIRHGYPNTIHELASFAGSKSLVLKDSFQQTKFNESGSKYLREMKCLIDGKADVYSVIVTFDVKCPARQHAIKKLLCSGIRGKGGELQDLKEARDAIDRAIQMYEAINPVETKASQGLTFRIKEDA